jgi:hypothetical protein
VIQLLGLLRLLSLELLLDLFCGLSPYPASLDQHRQQTVGQSARFVFLARWNTLSSIDRSLLMLDQEIEFGD